MLVSGRFVTQLVVFAHMSGDFAISYADVLAAADRIASLVHRTPVMTSAYIDSLVPGKRVFFKCELFQKTGSFKVRGRIGGFSCLQCPK